jgi:V/A-type H+-transporting ATPase subunit D
MAKISPTRMALLGLKSQIALTRQGYDLLDKKRTALMQEMMQLVDTVITDADSLQDVAADARQALAHAETEVGPEAVRAAALSSPGEFPVEITTKNIMGVKVPQIEQKPVCHECLDRGYSLTGTPISIDEAADAFESEVEAILRLADSELRLKRLHAEVQNTSRRLNALEYVVLPRLKTDSSYVQSALNERERSDHFRLKMAKRLLLRKRGNNPS